MAWSQPHRRHLQISQALERRDGAFAPEGLSKQKGLKVMKILIVDDDDLILHQLSEIMAYAGFTDVTIASSAQNAAEVISASRILFDCFCLDIQMPDVNGIELCRWIRRQPDYESTPILMITGMTDKSYVLEAFAAGAIDYITKPFDPIELITRVKLAERLNAEMHKPSSPHSMQSERDARVAGRGRTGIKLSRFT